jgi:hypothetical protein
VNPGLATVNLVGLKMFVIVAALSLNDVIEIVVANAGATVAVVRARKLSRWAAGTAIISRDSSKILAPGHVTWTISPMVKPCGGGLPPVLV